MEGISKTELQEAIDRNYELAKRDVKESKEKYGIEKDLEKSFCFFVCWDLQRQFGLDLKRCHSRIK